MKIKFYTEDVVRKARMLRKKDLSFKHIARTLHIAHNTVQRWCLDIPSTNPWFLRSQQQHEKIKKSNAEIGRHLKITKNTARLLASMLYWGEGTKYPHTTAVSFCNSDPRMVKTFIELLRKGFTIDEAKFRIHLQLHTTHSRKKIFMFWSNLLGIPCTQFWKPTVTVPTRTMKRKDYQGTCTIRYHDYTVLLQLMGIYEHLGERWLSG